MNISDEELAADADKAQLGHNSLAYLTDLVQHWKELQQKLSDLEAEVKTVKAVIQLYEMDKIPDAMVSSNAETITTTDGAQVSVKPIVQGNIPEKNRGPACVWLREHGHEDIIKQDVTISFTKGQDEQAQALCKELEEKGFAPVSKELVHASTLKSWALEQITNGNPDLDDEAMKLLGIFHARRAKIKLPKN